MRGRNGGAKRDRTADLLHAMQALSQLSYGPLPWSAGRVGPAAKEAVFNRAGRAIQAASSPSSFFLVAVFDNIGQLVLVKDFILFKERHAVFVVGDHIFIVFREPVG